MCLQSVMSIMHADLDYSPTPGATPGASPFTLLLAGLWRSAPVPFKGQYCVFKKTKKMQLVTLSPSNSLFSFYLISDSLSVQFGAFLTPTHLSELVNNYKALYDLVTLIRCVRIRLTLRCKLFPFAMYWSWKPRNFEESSPCFVLIWFQLQRSCANIFALSKSRCYWQYFLRKTL